VITPPPLEFGDPAFFGCSGLTAITVDAANPNYSSVDGVLFDNHQTVLLQYPAGKAGACIVPNSVTRISSWAFYDCHGLERLIFTGNAPTMVSASSSTGYIGFTAYYFNGATGFTSPTWNGYPSVNMGAYSPAAPWLLSKGFPHDKNLLSVPNNDGVPLLLAYALNLDPTQNQSGNVPLPVADGNQMSLGFYAGSEGVTYAVEVSADLKTWTETGVTLSALDANNFRAATFPMTTPRCFMRLKVSY
jgi:hypothetical protein